MRAFGILAAVAVAVTLALGAGCASKSAVGPSPSVTPPATAVPSAPASVSVSPTATATAAPTSTPSSVGPAGGPVPPGFSPASVTFVSLQTGWVLGSTCATCTVSILRTRDGGKTWVAIPAPPTTLQAGATTTRVRFADLANGWVFGGGLWATHDGGAHWIRQALPHVTGDVQDVEASAGVAHAVGFAEGNAQSGFDILTTPVGQDAWQTSPTNLPVGAGPVPQLQIVLQRSTGWIVQNDRTVVDGARLVGGAWVPWPPPPAVGGAALLAASTPQYLVAASNEGIWTGPPTGVGVFVSSDGIDVRRVATRVPATSIDAVASASPGVIVLAGETQTAKELLRSSDGGLSWTTVYTGGQGFWRELGFTSPTQGVVIDTGTDAQPDRFLMTHDGGRTWAPVPLTQAPP